MYEVGQILYTIIENKQKIYPVKVIEQVIKKTLEGETIEYTVKIPGTKDRNISLTKFKKVFINLDEVNDYLTNNAKSAISKMIDSAKEMQDSFFETKLNFIKEEQEETIIDDSCNNENNNVIIELGNGQKGKISISNLEDIGQKKT